MPVCALWAMLVVWSAGVAIPGVNETHYLGKARHWWNPDWCAGDFFLDSSNPHLVFYATFGALTQWLTLGQSAVAGRALALLIVALGWQNFAQCLTGKRWAGVIAMPVFLALHAIGNFSGEWVVGGIESKVPAYGFLFWGFGCLLSRRFIAAGLCGGLAISFHPLVGLWGILCALFATGISLRLRQNSDDSLPYSADATPLPVPSLVAGIVVCGLVSLPGLLPALQTLGGGTPNEARIATRLQVLDRLSHHLDPMAFPKTAYWYLGSLLAIWVLVGRDLLLTRRERWWRALVWCAVGIAAAGVLIGFGERPLGKTPLDNLRCWLLKFYFFRLADIVVPVALSLTMAQVGLNWLAGKHLAPWRRASMWIAWLVILVGAYLIPFPDQNASRLSGPEYERWLAAYHWVREHTPEDAMVYSTDLGWGVKWFTQRPEYVNYKDVPQDTVSVIEWNRRLWVIANWRIKALEDGEVSLAELAELRRQTGIRTLLVGRFGPVAAVPAYSNQFVKVYELP